MAVLVRRQLTPANKPTNKHEAGCAGCWLAGVAGGWPPPRSRVFLFFLPVIACCFRGFKLSKGVAENAENHRVPIWAEAAAEREKDTRGHVHLA